MRTRAGAPATAVIAVAAVVVAVVLAGCGAPSPDPPRAEARTVTWARTPLPGPGPASFLSAGAGGSVLLGVDGAEDGRRAPALLRVRGTRVLPVPVEASSYYGQRSVWHGLVEEDPDHWVAFGGRSGGAHGTVRWTTWSGRSRLSEDPQDFETFGGTRAGGLVALVDPGRPMLIGSRVSPAGGALDIAIWDLRERRWVRRNSAGTFLAADAGQQPSAHAAAARGSGVVIAGSITRYRPGAPSTEPAVWTAPSARGPWSRVALPAPAGSVTEATGVTCAADRSCAVAGTSDGRLSAWSLRADGSVERLDVPRLRVAEPVLLAGNDDGALAIVGGGHLFVGTASRLEEWRPPPGPAAGLAVAGGRVWVLAGSGVLRTTPLRLR